MKAATSLDIVAEIPEQEVRGTVINWPRMVETVLSARELSAQAYDVDNPGSPEKAKIPSAAGRAQALAMPFGKGRVVVFAEAAMLTAQNKNFGLNYPNTDDRQN